MKKTLILLCTLLLSASAFADAMFSDSYFLFSNDVMDFSETGISENVRNGEFVNPSPEDLKVGSVFIDADGILKKVVSITESADGTVNISTIQPELSEAFHYVLIPEQKLTLSMADLDALYESGPTQSADGSVARLAKSFGPYAYDFWLDDDKTMAIRLNDMAATVNIVVDFSFELPYLDISTNDSWWPWNWTYSRKDGHITLDYSHNIGLMASVGLHLETLYMQTATMPLLTVGIPDNGAWAEINLTCGVDGALDFSNKVTIRTTADAAAGCKLKGLSVVAWPEDCYARGSAAGYFGDSIILTGSGTVSIGPGVELGVALLGYKLGSIIATAGPYVALTGSFSYNFSYNKLDGDWGINQKILNTGSDAGWHFDNFSDIIKLSNTKLELTAGLLTFGRVSFGEKGKWGYTFLDTDSPKWTIFNSEDYNK